MNHLRICAIIAVLVVSSALAMSGCSGPRGSSPGQKPVSSAQKDKPAAIASRIRVESKGVKELSWQEGGHYVMRASAASLSLDETTGKSKLTKARVVLYKLGSAAVEVTADSIDADNASRILTATGGVRASSLVKGAGFTADTVAWNQANQQITASGNIVAHTASGKLWGDSLVGGTDLERLVLSSRSGGRAVFSGSALESRR